MLERLHRPQNRDFPGHDLAVKCFVLLHALWIQTFMTRPRTSKFKKWMIIVVSWPDYNLVVKSISITTHDLNLILTMFEYDWSHPRHTTYHTPWSRPYISMVDRIPGYHIWFELDPDHVWVWLITSLMYHIPYTLDLIETMNGYARSHPWLPHMVWI